MRVLMQRSQQVKIARVTFKMLAGPVRVIAVLDMPWDLLPRPPIVAMIAAFDLMRRLKKAALKYGDFTMLWHNSSFSTPDDVSLFSEILAA